MTHSNAPTQNAPTEIQVPAQSTTTLQQDLARIALADRAKVSEFERSQPIDFLSAGPHFEELNCDLRGKKLGTKLMAYYLPQYYPLPENDLWWGKGFTEWTNVVRARSRYQGHYQPRLPRDLGYYDLRVEEVMQLQAEYAQRAGVHAWCFYYYCFGSRRVMDTVLDQFLANNSIKQPFCLMWANENWARNWQGKPNDILVAQDYDPKHDDFFIADLARHMSDSRYVQIDGRPVFYIYRPSLIPQAEKRIDAWRNHLAQRFQINVNLQMAHSYDDERDPRVYGLEGAVQFPPHGHFRSLKPLRVESLDTSAMFQGHTRSYRDLIAYSLNQDPPDYPLMRCATPNWDNEARKPNQGYGYHGSSPALYQYWLSELIKNAQAKPIQGESRVAINAWNEWAEGAYLEPDVHYGAAYLNATARALTGSND